MQVIFEFENLKCLYLHGNKIKYIEECDKLAKLSQLNSLTVHGNPIENIPGFRLYLVSKLPKLKHLNFAGISKAEKQTAKTFMQTYHGKMKVIDENTPKKQHKIIKDDD